MNRLYVAGIAGLILFAAGFGAGVFYRAETHTRWQIVRTDNGTRLLDRQNGDIFDVGDRYLTRQQVRALSDAAVQP